MENKTLNDLHANPKNPRQISKHDFEALKKSIVKFGDISGIVFNRTTDRLVGGHQRTQAFKMLDGEKKITITQNFEQPNSVGTVAIGYVSLNGEHYSYREVEWQEDLEIAANIAANRIQGEWDMDLLAEMNYWLNENNPDLLQYTGEEKDEINRLLGQVSGEGEDDKYTKEVVAPTYEPTGDKPNVNELVDLDKTNQLLSEIDASEISDDDKQILKLAAHRHNVFNYESVAEYYAHSSAIVQDLMEKSALVIIDYDKAVEYGFTKLSNEVTEAQKEDYAE